MPCDVMKKAIVAAAKRIDHAGRAHNNFQERRYLMAITIKDVQYVAELSELSLTEEETTSFTETFNAILNYMESLNELDTSAVAPTTHVLPLENVFREDKTIPCLEREKALAAAPDRTADCFKVPKIL